MSHPPYIKDDEESQCDRNRYKWIIQQGKEIARLGQAGRKFVWMMGQMNGILHELVTGAKDLPLPETEQNAERKTGHKTVDIRIRSAKRGDRTQNAFSVKGRGHVLRDCEYKSVLNGAIDEYPGKVGKGTKCTIWQFSGHNRTSCRCLKDAQERSNELRYQ
jgi:hypothetical protein